MIRDAQEKDTPAIRSLMESEPGLWQSHWSDANLMMAIASAKELALVWEQDSKILGFACAHDCGFRGYLSELVIAEGVRRQGVGRDLVQCIERRLADRGLAVVIADVWYGAVPFYRSCGWSAPDVILLRRALTSADGLSHNR